MGEAATPFEAFEEEEEEEVVEEEEDATLFEAFAVAGAFGEV